MALIFFDLETSDKEPCGQILNYSFIHTDNNFQIISELSGDIAISILQIPSPEALLTNRVKVLDHQSKNFDSEPEALLKIARFISQIIDTSANQVYLGGYNSSRFDIPYLRTSFIRNGINPYFAGKIKYFDIFQHVKKAFSSFESFPTPFDDDNQIKLSLKLERICKELGILKLPQTHQSRDDVLLTIELSKSLNQNYQLHPASYLPYEPGTAEEIIKAVSPNYDRTTSQDRLLARTLALLNQNYRSALWIDLEVYKNGAGRDSISWFSKSTSQFIIQKFEGDLNEAALLLKKAKEEFSNLTPDNFFAKSSCDIEQDIYRLDIQKISALGQIIWNNERSLLKTIKDPDLQELITRFWLAYGVGSSSRGDKWKEKFSAYSNCRYASERFKILKFENDLNKQNERSNCHQSLKEIKANIFKLLSDAENTEDKEILMQLENFIESSEINKALTIGA